MTDFIFPSDQDRADDDELNRVCQELECVMDDAEMDRKMLDVYRKHNIVLQADQDALVAHVERLVQLIGWAEEDQVGPEVVAGEFYAVMGDAPTTSLARLKAEAKNELLSTVREMDITNSNGAARLDSEWRAGWNQCIRELRRQAEEPTE